MDRTPPIRQQSVRLAGLLAQRLKRDGVYVGEVMIYGTIKGTPMDSGNAIDLSAIADKFWELYQSRGEMRAEIRQTAACDPCCTQRRKTI